MKVTKAMRILNDGPGADTAFLKEILKALAADNAAPVPTLHDMYVMSALKGSAAEVCYKNAIPNSLVKEANAIADIALRYRAANGK